MDGTVVVVGGGLAGYSVVHRLREGRAGRSWEGPVHLVCGEAELPYDRPPLSKEVLRGDWTPDRAQFRPLDWYDEHDVTLHLGVRAEDADPDARTVTLDDGKTLDWEHLVLATGGRPRHLNLPGADLEGVHVLRTVADSTAIHRATNDVDTAVVVGAGFIGCEVAASLHARGVRTTVLEAAEAPMARILGTEVGAMIARLHAEQGVRIHCGTVPERFEGVDHVDAVTTADGQRIPAGLVVVGIGISPDVELAHAVGADVEDGVIVGSQGRTSVANVWAAGDIARHPNPYVGDLIRVEHFQNASSQGDVVAKAILGRDDEHSQVPWFWSDQYDVSFQYVGHTGEWDEIVWRGDPDAHRYSAFWLHRGRLVAALGANRPKDVKGARACMEAGIAVTPEQLSDPQVDLRKLTKAP